MIAKLSEPSRAQQHRMRWIGAAAVWVTMFTIEGFRAGTNVGLDFISPPRLRELLFIGIVWLVWIVVAISIVVAGRRIELPNRRAAIVAVIPLIAGFAMVMTFMRAFVRATVVGGNLGTIWPEMVRGEYLASVEYLAMVIGVTGASRALDESEARAIRQVQLQSEISELTSRGLAAALDPDFVARAMARICAALETGSAEAGGLIADLADIVRDRLQPRSGSILLRHEVDVVHRYLDFFRDATGGAVRSEVTVNGQPDKILVPPAKVPACMEKLGAAIFAVNPAALDLHLTIEAENGDLAIEIEMKDADAATVDSLCARLALDPTSVRSGPARMSLVSRS